MIRTLLIFLLLLGSIWLGVQLHEDTGYVLIALNHWTVEATVWTMFIALLFIFLVLHLFLITLNWIAHIPQRWHYWRLKRKAKQALKKQHAYQINELHTKISFETTPEGYFTIGQLLDELEDKKGANIAYREGLRRALGIA